MYQSQNNQRGVAIIELAVVLLVLFMILFGIMELGRAVWYYNTLGHATHEGARFATVNGSTSGSPPGPRLAADTELLIKNRVISAATGLGLAISDVTVSWPLNGNNTPNNKPGSTVTVTATKVFVPTTSFVGGFTMRRSATLTIVR